MFKPTDDDTLLNPAMFVSQVMRIEPEWIDYNGHLNMAYYNVLFDRGLDQLWLKFGMGPNYIKTRNNSTFTAEAHVRYVREIHLNDPVQVMMLLVATDDKRIHSFQELRHAEEGWLSATSENMSLHMDMSIRKVAPFPADVRANVEAIAQAHRMVPKPVGIGRRIEMPARKQAV